MNDIITLDIWYYDSNIQINCSYIKRSSSSIYLDPVNERQLTELILNLKSSNSTSKTSLKHRVLKIIYPTLLPHFVDFLMSLEHGSFPNIFETLL